MSSLKRKKYDSEQMQEQLNEMKEQMIVNVDEMKKQLEDYCTSWIDNHFKEYINDPNNSIDFKTSGKTPLTGSSKSIISRLSYSQLKLKDIEKELNIAIQAIISVDVKLDDFKEILLNNLKSKLSDDLYRKLRLEDNEFLKSIREKIFKSINKLDDLCKLFKNKINYREELVQDYVAIFIKEVLSAAIELSKSDSLLLAREEEIINPNTQKARGRVEFILKKVLFKISKINVVGFSIDKLEDYIETNLMIVKVKKSDLSLGHAQNLVQLNDSYKSDKLNESFIFGVASTGSSFKFTIYDGQDYIISDTIEKVLYKGMHKEEDEKWSERKESDVIDVLYFMVCHAFIK